MRCIRIRKAYAGSWIWWGGRLRPTRGRLPIRWVVDARFGISKNTLAGGLKDAEAIWEEASGKGSFCIYRGGRGGDGGPCLYASAKPPPTS